MVFQAAVASGYVALAVAGILGTVIGAYYYMKIIKVMYHGRAGGALSAASSQPIQGLLILIAAAGHLAARLSPDRTARIASPTRAAGSLF